jgi:hypothetical protein
VIFGGEHVELLRRNGWSKQRIREFVVEKSGRTVAELKRAGRLEGAVMAADEKTIHHALREPDDPMVLCAGSPIGLLSMVMPGFGGSREAGRSPTIRIE